MLGMIRTATLRALLRWGSSCGQPAGEAFDQDASDGSRNGVSGC